MSHDAPHGAPHGGHRVSSRHGGGGSGWKWLAIAGAAVVVLGGGWWAWQNYNGAPRADQEIAYEDVDTGYAAEPADYAALDERAGPLEPEPVEQAAIDETRPVATPASAPARRPRTQTAAATTPAAQPASDSASGGPVPLTVVGVTPASMTTYEDEEVVVEGRRRPVWTRTPSNYRLSTAYPERALERGREGEATVACTVVEAGALDCTQVSESSSGFGRAALRVARMFRHAPQNEDGSSTVGAPVNLRVVFRLADEDNRRRG